METVWFLLKERRASQSNANSYFICLIDVKAPELDVIHDYELPIDLPLSCCREDTQVLCDYIKSERCIIQLT